MEVTDELFDNLADLSRLKFSAEEKSSIKKDLEKMIAFVDKLNELDTADVQPLIHMTDNYNILREDKVVPSISREEGLSNAPSHDEAFFKVPKVIKKS